MNAEAERGVAVFLAVDHDLVRIGKHRGIAVGGGNDSSTMLPGFTGQPLITVSFITSRAIVTGE